MYDAASLSDGAVHQRAIGELRVAVHARGEETALRGLRQAGCLKARFPRPHAPGWLDVVTLNTSGGVAAGDRLDLAFAAGGGTRATISAQAAERFYRALPGSLPARVRTRIDVAAGATAEWLPQETILFDGCAVDRALDVELHPAGAFLGMETLVFGRLAMGERVRAARLAERVRIRRAGRLLLHDAIRLNGAVDAALARPAVANGARALASLVHVAPGAEARLDAVRDALASAAEADGVEAGASAWNGMLLARILGAEAGPVRRAVTAVLAVLRQDRALPRVWLC